MTEWLKIYASADKIIQANASTYNECCRFLKFDTRLISVICWAFLSYQVIKFRLFRKHLHAEMLPYAEQKKM